MDQFLSTDTNKITKSNFRRICIIVFATVLFLPVNDAAVIDSKGEGCTSVAMEEDELRLFRNIYRKLDKYLERNLEHGHQNLEKVLSGFGVYKDVALKVDLEAPLENTLLQHQIAIHQDMKRMFGEVKSLLGSSSPFGTENEVLLKESRLKEGKDDKSSLKERGDERNTSLDSFGELTRSLLREVEIYKPTDSAFRPADCSEVLVAGHKESGVYNIYPFKCQCTEPVEVYCDMDTDGGGWTVFLSRKNTSKPINFTRNWEEYKAGFGTAGKEHWLGNEYLHTLTYNRNYILRLEAKDGEGREVWGEWKTFKIDSEELKYKLSVTTFNAKSTAYDRFAYVNNNFFSTYDQDSDKQAKQNCAESYKGGWWYNACHNNNPTGEHDKIDGTGIQISPWSKIDKKIRYAVWLQLKIRPKICSNSISVAKVNTHNCALN